MSAGTPPSDIGVQRETLFTFRTAKAAIEREREFRHLTIPQLRERLGEHWPGESATIRRDADAAVDWLAEALEMLRGAWNLHMRHCPQPRTHGVTPEQIEAWKNAPSDTASAS